MAKNQDTSQPNRNTLYLACSGGGKSQAVYQNKEIPKRGARVVLWDPDEDHPAARYYNLPEFRRALIAALKRGGGFRIAYSGDADVKGFETWCAMIWTILDGKKPTFVIIEELATVTETVSKATKNFGVLLNRGRKYGARIHLTTQRGTEISKTAYIQCPTKFVGIQEGSDVDRMAKLCALTVAQIRELKPLEYWRKAAGKEPEKVRLNYIKPIHQKTA